MLAYIFWHRPQPMVERPAYEAAQRAFHGALGMRSACFRLATLPFAPARGYEDWYLIEGWGALADLNAAALDSTRRAAHDAAAALALDGWGGVYALAHGEAEIPEGAQWLDRPRDVETAEFISSIGAESVWQRQLVLGPAPELCVAAPPEPGRERIV